MDDNRVSACDGTATMALISLRSMIFGFVFTYESTSDTYLSAIFGQTRRPTAGARERTAVKLMS
jgi:hypothetical protein